MSRGRHMAVLLALLTAFALLLAFGSRVFGDGKGVAVMIGTFVVGFACLRLLVAPWAFRPRRETRPRR